MSNGASLAPQDIRIDFVVLPETNCQGLFNQPLTIRTLKLHLNLAGFVLEHALNFVAHSFVACGAEMDAHLVGGLAYLLHKGGRLHYRGGAVC